MRFATHCVFACICLLATFPKISTASDEQTSQPKNVETEPLFLQRSIAYPEALGKNNKFMPYSSLVFSVVRSSKKAAAFALDAQTGEIAWKTTLYENIEPLAFYITPVPHNGLLYCPVGTEIVALHAGTGKEAGRFKLDTVITGNVLVDLTVEHIDSMFIAGKQLFMSTMHAQANQSKLYAISLDLKTVQWETKLGDCGVSNSCYSDDFILVYQPGGMLHVISPKDGEIKRSVQMQPQTGLRGQPWCHQKMLYWMTEDGTLTAVNLQTGRVSWEQKLGTVSSIPPAHYKNQLLVSVEKHLLALEAKTGKELWRHETSGMAATNLVVRDDQVWFDENDQCVTALNLKDQTVVATHRFPEKEYKRLLFGRRMLISQKTRIDRYDDTGEIVAWNQNLNDAKPTGNALVDTLAEAATEMSPLVLATTKK